MGFFFEKNPMTNKIKKFLYTLEHLIPDGRDEIPTFALYPLLTMELLSHLMVWLSAGAQLGVVTCFTAAPGNFSPGREVEHNSYQVTSREMRGIHLTIGLFKCSKKAIVNWEAV